LEGLPPLAAQNPPLRSVAAVSMSRSWRRGRRGPECGGACGKSIGRDTLPGTSPRDGAINTFNGPHKFLSNFFWSEFDFEGLRYSSVEHAFQAAKLKTNDERAEWGFTSTELSFGAAKRLGRQVPLRNDWKDIRENVMFAFLEAKFTNPELSRKLLNTADKELIDGHSGSPDLIWGYHFPSQAGQNRLGHLLMTLREKMRAQIDVGGPSARVRDIQTLTAAGSHSMVDAAQCSALFHLDWPMKCLHDGLPTAYAKRIVDFARELGLAGILAVLPRRKICIVLRGSSNAINEWEHRVRTENVDMNSRGRPCRERMLVELLRAEPNDGTADVSFRQLEADTWSDLCWELTEALVLQDAVVSHSLGPEPPELPKHVRYGPNRTAVYLDGKRFALCLNDNDALTCGDALLGEPETWVTCGMGAEISLSPGRDGKPCIFGGKFARKIRKLFDVEECQKLITLAEKTGFGLAGSRGFNPFARFALRCLVDAPRMAALVTSRLRDLLPIEYPPGSGRPLVGVNERCRFLKYLPGMHHGGDHTDCAHEDERGRSFLTLQVYLNVAFRGGRTTFISDALVPIEPELGCGVVFDHELYHRGGMVTEGIKYALRMDVLYGPPGSAPMERTKALSLPADVLQLSPGNCSKQQRTNRWGKERTAAPIA